MARPKLINSRSAVITLRIDPDRKERYRRAAKRHRATLTAWLLDQADRALLTYAS
jgi:uncharacterized protein (DUF1778 family)